MPKAKPMKVGVYIILDAKRQAPPNYEIPLFLAPLEQPGTYVELPNGSPKGAFIHSIAYTGSPVEDIYTVHFVATADVSYPNGEPVLTFQPEAHRIFELLGLAFRAESAGREMLDNVLAEVAEVVANETTGQALGWIADQRRKVARAR